LASTAQKVKLSQFGKYLSIAREKRKKNIIKIRTNQKISLTPTFGSLKSWESSSPFVGTRK
jgi:hypothetical protein